MTDGSALKGFPGRLACLALGLVAACHVAAPASPGPPTDVPRASPRATARPATPAASRGPGRTLEPVHTPAAGSDEWQYLPGFAAESALEVTDVTAWRAGFVAVGFEPAAGEGFAGRRNGVLWTSPDGLSWQRERPGEFENVTLLRLVEQTGRLFAFGSLSLCPEFTDDDECEDLPDAGIAAWRSADGRSWQRLVLPDSLRLAILDGVEVGPQGLLAYGSTGEEFEARIWLSADGDTWTELADVGEVDPVSALAAGPTATVIFGTRYMAQEDEVETLAAVGGPQGFAPAALPAGQRGSVLDAAWGDTGFVAVGLDDRLAAEGYLPLLLHSADGQKWDAPSVELPDGAGLHAVSRTPQGYVVLGSMPAEGGREQALALFSTDGRSWQSPAVLEGGLFRQFSALASGSPGEIVFTTDFDATDEEDPLGAEGSRIRVWVLPRGTGP